MRIELTEEGEFVITGETTAERGQRRQTVGHQVIVPYEWDAETGAATAVIEDRAEFAEGEIENGEEE